MNVHVWVNVCVWVCVCARVYGEGYYFEKLTVLLIECMSPKETVCLCKLGLCELTHFRSNIIQHHQSRSKILSIKIGMSKFSFFAKFWSKSFFLLLRKNKLEKEEEQMLAKSFFFNQAQNGFSRFDCCKLNEGSRLRPTGWETISVYLSLTSSHSVW